MATGALNAVFVSIRVGPTGTGQMRLITTHTSLLFAAYSGSVAEALAVVTLLNMPSFMTPFHPDADPKKAS